LSAVPDVDDAPDLVEDASFDAFEDADVDVDIPDDQPDVDAVDEPAPEADSPLRPTTGPRPARSGKRASVPSWDEILFGGPSAPED
jgi:hypothetical protein